ncbi:MAG: cell wall metabolism sensor histidine kinase WalK, partial [Apilactobacillus sp.]|nr:cell wall metabolism sensor histidine kinase WalK [Apilactobacillus sp.]
MNSKIKYFQSIHFKIALVLALILLVTLEIVGAVFVNQLENKNMASFKKQVQVPTYVNTTLTNELSSSSTTKANVKIKSLLSNIDSNNYTEIKVVDAKNTIRGTNEVGDQSSVGQKNFRTDIKNAIINRRSSSSITSNPGDSSRYYTVITPLIKSSNNELVGVVYVHANLNTVYNEINQITVIYVVAAVVAILSGLLISIVISKAITKPIDEMKKQTLQIARGDYSGQVHVYGRDELGQLANAVNNLSVKVEESQESTESERQRLDSVLTNMTDGVIATDRRGYVIIMNDEAASFLETTEQDALGNSILDILDIRKEYSLRDLIENPDETIIDRSDKDHDLILHAHFSLIQRDSGFVSGLVCVLHDVTEQQKIDNDRKEFVSNVSHELRTPLTSVHSYIEALQDGAWKDPEIAPNFLKVTQEETDRMIRMINDLLTLSRMDSGTQKIDKELVNITELFNYILNRFDMIIKSDDNNSEKPNKHYRIERRFT